MKYTKIYSKNNDVTISPNNNQDVIKLLILIDKICTMYPFEAQCLHRSFLGYRYIRKQFGIPVDLVIGVRKFPFYAHAWLKLRDKNVNESDEFTRDLIVILSSSEGEKR
ncbi:lasso peptide biosynthesis B2 protein [Paenibacillus sp. MBLB4367]|uniref:lasso peptide biosynthesis B2 protein n=1 Tax=Paenibacillus sp. MBLB4367 TaxID=3384767 RepID=UPI0039082E22